MQNVLAQKKTVNAKARNNVRAKVNALAKENAIAIKDNGLYNRIPLLQVRGTAPSFRMSGVVKNSVKKAGGYLQTTCFLNSNQLFYIFKDLFD